MKETKLRFRAYLRNRIYSYRIKFILSQKQMAELLHISHRSYIEQEHSKCGFSAMSFAYYMLLLTDEEILQIFRNLRTLLSEEDTV